MTGYTAEDLENEWEFKIVRSATGAFRKPEKLKQLLDEEAVAGWVMIEKFDDGRVRFKRRMSMREKDGDLPRGADPYRSRFGAGEAAYAMVAVGIMLALGLGLVLALLLLR